MDKITYLLEADTHIAPLELEYSQYEFILAVKHFKKWLKDKEIFNQCFYRVTTEGNKIKEKKLLLIE